MQFDSLAFAVFLPVLWVAYRLTNRNRWVLLAGSLLFYGWWDWRYLSLIGGSSAAAYFFGTAIGNPATPTRRTPLLLLSVGLQLGLLIYFKYWNLLTDTFLHLRQALGGGNDIQFARILLPVGISFFTFQNLSYTVDVWRGTVRRSDSLVDYLLYISFFPQLVAGPIERYSDLHPQLVQRPVATWKDYDQGFALLIVGFFKKVVIADTASDFADRVFNNPTSFSGPSAIFGIYFFALQIYADFSAYTDIARGCGLLFGIRLIDNFQQPYLSTSITEFWRRWHISLSGWLRDYLYFPLGGNRGGLARTIRNLCITMVLGGIWHGASWNFLIWGFANGFMLSAEKLYHHFTGHRVERAAIGLGGWVRRFVTLNMICLTWVFFRAADLPKALEILGQCVRIPLEKGELLSLGKTLEPAAILCVLGGLMMGHDLLKERRGDGWFLSLPTGPRMIAAGLMIAFIALNMGNNQNAFIYFQF